MNSVQKNKITTKVWMVKLVDFLVVLLAGFISYYLKFGNFNLNEHYRLGLLICLIVSTFVFQFSGMYRVWENSSFSKEISSIFLSTLGLFVFCAVLMFITKTSEEFSREWYLIWIILTLISLIINRIVLRLYLIKSRSYGKNLRSIVVVGSGKVALRTIEHLAQNPWVGYKIYGYFGITSNHIINTQYLGSLDSLVEYVERNKIDEVWICKDIEELSGIKSCINGLSVTTVDVKYVPDIFGFELLNHSVDDLNGLPIINITVSPMEGTARILKAFEDRIISIIILILISPVMAAIAIGVKLSSKGPIFYKQQRVSWNGTYFNMLKFRSMPVNSESNGVIWGGSKDKVAKMNWFCKFIRKSSLDELPQFINVLKGEMSIVGPRPERPMFVEQFKHEIPRYMLKHKVKAGITGWAQINGWRGDTDLNKRIEADLYYIDNWSLFLDIKIIFLTIFKGFFHKNAS